MTSRQNIQTLTFTVDVDIQAINNQVGPLVLSTTKPYRMRRNSQPRTIARTITVEQGTTDIGNGNRGTLGSLSVEILWLIFDRMNVQTFVTMKRVCKSIKVIAENSPIQKTLRYISAAEPKSLSLFMRSKLGSFYTTPILDVFFEKICSLCHENGDGIFLPTMTRICLNCSENSEETSCICMTTAMEKYSLTESQIVEARIPIMTNAIPNGNLKLLPETLVRGYALSLYGSMTGVQFAFERNKQWKMEKYEIQYAKWETESRNFDNWVELVEPVLGNTWGQWPDPARAYYFAEKERLKKKPKLPRQAFDANDTPTASREASTTKYLTRKAKMIDRNTGVSESFCYCLGCRKNVLPAAYLIVTEGGSLEDVRVAQHPYLQSSGELLQHQETCVQTIAMRHEHQQRLVMAVRKAIEDEQGRAIFTAMEF